MLLDAIDTSTTVGLRDHALIALMTFTFARGGAAAGKLRVEDVYVQCAAARHHVLQMSSSK